MAASVEIPSTPGLSHVFVGASQPSLAPPKASTDEADLPELPQDDARLQTVDELLRSRARTNPHDVIVSYPSSGIDYVDYTTQQLDVFAYRVGRYYQELIPSRRSSTDKPTVVALLGPSNFEYLVTMLALTKLGHTVLFLSTRISRAAIESLLSTTEAEFLLADGRFLEVARGSVREEKLSHVRIAEIAGRGLFEFPVDVYADTRLDGDLDHNVETNNYIYIIHSSGSTGLPKPIYQTQKSALANYSSSMSMRAFITLPLYHNHGICNLYRAIYAKKPIHLYNADLPLTHEYLTKIMQRHKFEIFYGVPYALKLLAETETGVEVLRQLKIVMYGGSACPDELGDFLVNNGVNIVGHYGATEVGQLMTSFRPPEDKAWNYVREHDKLSPYLTWILRGPNLFECCVKPGWPAKVASNQEDGSYTTKDLFEPHPTHRGWWKYVARRDDTIALVNGEKFNPVQTEGRIRSNKLVAEAVVFGTGRPYLGLLVVPSPLAAGMSDAEVVEVVWEMLEASGTDEAYARISRGMIRVLPRDAQYPRTDKGSLIRQAFYQQFAKEIEDAYDAAEMSQGAGALKALTVQEIRDFLRDSLVKIIPRAADVRDDGTDFFTMGLDSLQAIQMRSEILKNINTRGQKLGQNVVFDYPTIDKLASYLFKVATGFEEEKVRSVEDEMEALISKYGDFSPRITSKPSSVVVTGATGSLGAHVAACLSHDETISRIYCLVRAKDQNDACRRLHDSLTQRRLYESLPPGTQHKIIPLASDLGDKNLGLARETYQELTGSLRSVIHCAWAVNFNMHLSSFERDCIAGVTHLIDLCLASTATNNNKQTAPSFNFCSSVSAVVRGPNPAPETLPKLEWAQGMGYAQSKVVAEHVCLRAAEKTGLRARVLRVGQIVADSRTGIWNATEGITLMLQSALTVGALPRLRERPCWLPVDTVARSVAEIALSEDAPAMVANVANHRLFDWTDDLLPMLRRAGLEFEEVEPREWVRRLRESESDPAVNPPVKLVDFFASKYDRDEFLPSKTYVTDAARSYSPALANAPVLDQELVNKFVGHFLSTAWKGSV